MRNLPVIDYADAKKIIDLIVEKAAQMSAPAGFFSASPFSFQGASSSHTKPG